MAVLLIFAILFACVYFLIKNDEKIDQNALFSKQTNTNSQIGVSYSLIGNTRRITPETKDEGLARYPVYGQNLTKADAETEAEFTALKQAILAENAYLNADPDATLSSTCSNYDSLDKNGYLYLNGSPALDDDGNHRKLYKHTASNNMYFGNVSDSEPAVVKRIDIQPRAMGNYITGLYAPAGEVIKLTISAGDLKIIENIFVYVGATLANGQANNIWLARDFNRMPVIANKMPVNAEVCSFDARTQTYTCYFGSYLGGPIYLGSPSIKMPFSVEISGAVEYPHFIYGLTTEAEYNRLLKSTAPYFDMEIFDISVRFSGARTHSDRYSYAELCQSAELWDKISQVSRRVPTGSNSSYGIDFLFEPFIAAGAAVAFVGRNTVNCPLDWMDTCLDVENFINNGAWGNIHEFNHHYQNFGLPNGGEVTNNAITLVEYSLFTKISSKRSLGDSTLRDWNIYTDPSRAMRVLLNNSASGSAVESLDAYATILHSFGQSVFIDSTQNGSGVDNWFKNLCNLTHYNFEYYFTEILHETVSADVLTQVRQNNYPMYVPVACIYQTGTKYHYNNGKKQIKTAQPFEFEGENYEFSIKSLLHIPDGFTVNNIIVGEPEFGQISLIGDDKYRFTPAKEGFSGDFDVKISLSKNDNAFEVADITLVFGLKQQQKRIAERATFYFDNDLRSIFDDVDDAVAQNYAGFSSKAVFDSTFNNQECAAVWWNSDGVELNAITEYNSKIYIKSNATYRFSIRGKFANLYISLDGINYDLVAKAGENYNNNFAVSVQNGEFRDYSLQKGQIVYIKAVVLHYDVSRCAFVVGMGTVSNGSASLDDITKKITVYNANYEPEPFETEYFYAREYPISQFSMPTNSTSTVISTNFLPWDESTKLTNLFDDKPNTYMHNKQYEFVSEAKPFEIVVDLGKTIQANQIIMHGRATNPQTPTSYKLYGGLSLDEMTLLCEAVDEPLKNSCNQIGNFDLTTLRYYKLVVTKTNANYICLSNIEFNVDFSDGKMLSPDDKSVNYYGKWAINYDLSPFGHSYISQKGYAEFTFTGTQFALLSQVGTPAKFNIIIDDSSEILVDFDGTSTLLFLSDNLANSTHTIIIRPITTTNITAFATR